MSLFLDGNIRPIIRDEIWEHVWQAVYREVGIRGPTYKVYENVTDRHSVIANEVRNRALEGVPAD
jgi:hypothetical protein